VLPVKLAKSQENVASQRNTLCDKITKKSGHSASGPQGIDPPARCHCGLLQYGAERGAWIFVSHSCHDLEKARRIRNELERLRYESRPFWLKLLEDDSRLPELRREEIQVRKFSYGRSLICFFDHHDIRNLDDRQGSSPQ
jgi:hypothetical protein